MFKLCLVFIKELIHGQEKIILTKRNGEIIEFSFDPFLTKWYLILCDHLNAFFYRTLHMVYLRKLFVKIKSKRH